MFGSILPALGIALVLGNLFYAYLAVRLAQREGRTDVTAMPYGPSVPHMFIVVFAIMLPIFLATGDPVAAWQAGVAWAFIIAVIVLLGAFVGPYIRKFTPRAALLGTLAGISIAFISMRPAAQMWEVAWIAFPVLAIILIGFMGNLRLPGNFPVGLAALLVGSAIGWAGAAGHRDPAGGLQLHRGHDQRGERRRRRGQLQPAQRPARRRRGCGDRLRAGLGSPFPLAVIIGHPGWKKAGGRIGYSVATGVTISGCASSGCSGCSGR